MWSELQEARYVPYKIYSLSGKFAMLQAAVFTELSCLYGGILDHCDNKWLVPHLGPEPILLILRRANGRFGTKTDWNYPGPCQ